MILSKINDIPALERFITSQKKYGFLIGLDDIGAGHSTLSRLSIIQPDVIKVDRSIISNIHKEYYKQEILKSLVNLSHKIGALVVAEGIEIEEEIYVSMEIGADTVQGFGICKPKKSEEDILNCSTFFGNINNLSANFKKYILERISINKQKRQIYEKITDKILKDIISVSPKDFDDALEKIIKKENSVECIYILDENGIQVTETITNLKKFVGRKKLLYKGDMKGTDQAYKEYYFHLNGPGKKFITHPYISSASGNRCITVSSVFKTSDNEDYIICIDINPEII